MCRFFSGQRVEGLAWKPRGFTFGHVRSPNGAEKFQVVRSVFCVNAVEDVEEFESIRN